MIEKKKACRNNKALSADISVYDIDIDFELKSGKPVWVVILQKNGRNPQIQPTVDDAR